MERKIAVLTVLLIAVATTFLSVSVVFASLPKGEVETPFPKIEMTWIRKGPDVYEAIVSRNGHSCYIKAVYLPGRIEIVEMMEVEP